MVKFHSTNTSKKSLKSYGSIKSAGANVKGSNLNKGGDLEPRGKRGGTAKVGKSKMSY